MKTFVNFLTCTIIIFVFASFSTPDTKLVGKWKDISEDDITVAPGMINFDAEGYAFFIVDGEKMGGKDYSIEGKIASMYYETNDKVQPHSIDFIVKLNENNEEVGRLTGIYEYLSDTRINLCLSFEGERLEKIDLENEDCIVLEKVIE